MIWKAIFSFLGLASLFYILQGYGFPRLAADLSSLGWWSLPLALSFLPVTFCYAIAWQLVTPDWPLAKSPHLISFSIISVAWNNLSPFVKVLGEPVRMVLLEKTLSRKQAASSTILYNIVHVMGTLLSFFLGTLILLAFFPVSKGLRAGFYSLLILSPLLALALFFLPHLAKKFHKRPSKSSRFYLASFWLRWGLNKIRFFSHRYPIRFWAAVLMEVAARFVEGLTFYVAFLAMNHHVPIITCALLDVGRALIDNVFFFIPYQVGSREGGVLLLAEDAVRIGANQTVSAAIFYRLVEILWMGIGYILWIKESSVERSSR